VLDLAKDLISLESHSHAPGREQLCAEYGLQWLRRHGVACHLAWVEDGRPNLMARVGAPGGRRLMLNGHLDTIGGAGMDFPAFEPFVEAGRLYGRGACDMKGPLAAMMAAMVDLQDRELGGEVLFAGVIGEEERSEGTEALLRAGEAADFCMVGEPSDLQIHLGHRGLEWLEIRFHGVAAHSGAAERGHSAITAATTFVELTERHLRPRIEARRHPVLGASAINWGVIQGGHQPSVVAPDCTVQLDRRWIPGESIASLVGELEEMLEVSLRLHPGVRGEVRRMPSGMLTLDHVPTYVPAEHPGVRALAAAIRQETGEQPAYGRFPAWTDASLLHSYGNIPSVVFGPGSIDKAHSADEYVPLDALFSAARIYAEAAALFLGASPPREGGR